MSIAFLLDKLDDIKDTSSRLDKEELIDEILSSSSSHQFSRLVSFIYDPYRRLGVKVTSSMVDSSHELSCDLGASTDDKVWSHFWSILESMESGELTGKSARTAIVDFLAKLYPDHIEWFSQFFNKKLKAGIGRRTLEKFLGSDFAPKFDVQLCRTYDCSDLCKPYLIQPKLDGLRGVVSRFPNFNGEMVALSRNGKQLHNVGHIVAQLSSLESSIGYPCVFDGEFYADNWEVSMGILSRSTRSHDKLDSLKYHVFDVLPLVEWVSSSFTESLARRYSKLTSAEKHSSVIVVPSVTARLYSDIESITGEYLESGWEGAILKDPDSMYSFDRSASWLKHKDVKEVDAEIVGVKLGLHDSRSNVILQEGDPAWHSSPGKHVVRAIVVDPGTGVLTSVGSGLKLKDRYDFLELHEKGGLLGRVAEIVYQNATPDGKLRFPRLKRMRDDKSLPFS